MCKSTQSLDGILRLHAGYDITSKVVMSMSILERDVGFASKRASAFMRTLIDVIQRHGYNQPFTLVRTRTRLLSAVMYNVLPSSPNARFAVATPVASVPRCLPCDE